VVRRGVCRIWEAEKAPKRSVNVNYAGGRKITKRGGATVRGKNGVTIGSSKGIIARRENDGLLPKMRRSLPKAQRIVN
jgi:hypothetical protein